MTAWFKASLWGLQAAVKYAQSQGAKILESLSAQSALSAYS
jgi:hypothetical protein